jgi:hypothetical protein
VQGGTLLEVAGGRHFVDDGQTPGALVSAVLKHATSASRD